MIVESVFTPSVVHVRRSTCLQEAALTMREHHVGALVVTEDGADPNRPVGIVTDRDIVINGVADGSSPYNTFVGDVMTPALATVLRSDRVQAALDLMRTRGVRRLAVAENDGSLAGILSLDDVIDAITPECAGLQGIVRNEFAREIAVTAARHVTGAART